MRYMGIDYGKARMGIAVSDVGEKFAFPREVVMRESELEMPMRIFEIINSEEIRGVVIGLPHAMPGVSQDLAFQIREFAERLKFHTAVQVFFEDELFTTKIAERLSDKKSDAAAAALILQSFLDRKNKVS